MEELKIMSYYYYIEDDYCYYICHTEVDEVKLPLQKVNKYRMVSENAVKNVVRELNNTNSSLIYEYKEMLEDML